MSLTLTADSKPSAGGNVLARCVGEECVLLNLTTKNYFVLDHVSARFWQVLTSSDSVRTAYGTLLLEYDVEPERLQRELQDFVNQLLQFGLLQRLA